MRLFPWFAALVLQIANAQSFVPGALVPATNGCLFLVADFNLDYRPDVVCVGINPGDLSVYLASSAGSFSSPSNSISIEAGARDIATSDFNNDGKPDIVIAYDQSMLLNPHVRVWLGLGDGRFITSSGTLPSVFSPAPIRLAAADFDRDGNTDVAFMTSEFVYLLRGDGSGALKRDDSPALRPPALGYFADVSAGDTNRDGTPDLVLLVLGPQFASPARLLSAVNTGGGAFSTSVTSSAMASFSVTAVVELADVNGDQSPDAIGLGGAEKIRLWLNAGNGTFVDVPTTMPVIGIPTLAPADFNFDGKADVAAASYTGIVEIGLSVGNDFTPIAGSPFAVGAVPGNLAIGDLNGDHKPDFIVSAAGGLQVFLSNVPGSPEIRQQQIQFAAIQDQLVGAAPIQLSATANSGLAVSFASSTTQVCNVLSKTLVRTFVAGTCTITARQPGNQVWDPALPVVHSFPVAVSGQTITFAPLADRAIEFSPFAVTASASSGLGVSFAASPASVCAINGSQVMLVGLGVCSITASQPGNSATAAATPVTRTFAVTALIRLGPSITRITNAASYASGTLARSSYGVVFGTRFGSKPAVFLRDAAGVVRSVDQIYTGDTQVNFWVPTQALPGDGAIVVTTGEGSAEYSVTIALTAPGLFSADSSGRGLAAAQVIVVNSDKTVTSRLVVDGPIPTFPGTEIYLVLYGTGLRFHDSATALVGGISADVLYAGEQGEFPGLDQVNLRIPLSVAGRGEVAIQVFINGMEANTVTARFE